MALAVQELNNDVPYIGHCCIIYKTTNQEGIMSKPKYTTAQKRSQRYLRSVRLAERRIQVLEAEIELQQSRLTLNGVAGGENVKATMQGDSAEQGFTKLYELCDSLDTDLIGYVEEREEALNVLKHLSNPNHYMILYLRYFQGLSFSQVANIMNYTERNVFKLHLQALSALHPYLPVQYRQRVQ